jgi:hypothetical protein
MKYDFKYYQNKIYEDNYVRNLNLKIGFALFVLVSLLTSIIIIGVL